MFRLLVSPHHLGETPDDCSVGEKDGVRMCVYDKSTLCNTVYFLGGNLVDEAG